MSLFPRPFVSPNPTTSFNPLFRLLDDFDNYSSGNNYHMHRSHLAKSFSPKFDVKELADQYELYGDLPGIEQKDIEIEFTDLQTLTIRGRTQRSYNSGNPLTGRIENAQKGRITENGNQNEYNATAENEETAEAHETTTVATSQQQEPEAKYWVSERSMGEFHRSFSFPGRVNPDSVTASMKNGVISIVVPKAKKAKGRKITVSETV